MNKNKIVDIHIHFSSIGDGTTVWVKRANGETKEYTPSLLTVAMVIWVCTLQFPKESRIIPTDNYWGFFFENGEIR